MHLFKIMSNQISPTTSSHSDAARTAALYIRVSTQEQAELSPESQKRLLLDYAAAHGLSVPEEYIFTESVSGRRADKRPKFQEMIALAKHHAFQVILVWKYSRFARNQEESIVYKNRLKRDGVEVVSISEPSLSGPFGSLIERIIEWMDEYYSIRLSGDVFRGMSERARNGGHQARAPLGYRLSVPGGTLLPTEPEAGLVRRIFEEFLEQKKSPRQIAEALNREGLRTGSGGAFETRAVRYLLSNPAYAGILCWNRRGNTGASKNAPEDWIWAEAAFPPLISREAFFRAQARLNTGFPGHRPQTSAAASRSWLSGFVKCSACGRSLAISSHKGSRGQIYRSLQCCGYLKGRCPISHQISERALCTMIRTALSEKQKAGTLPEALLPLRAVPAAVPSLFSEPEGRLIRMFYGSIVYDAGHQTVSLTESTAASSDTFSFIY